MYKSRREFIKKNAATLLGTTILSATSTGLLGKTADFLNNLNIFVIIYAYWLPDPISKGGLMKSCSIVLWFHGPTESCGLGGSERI